MSLSKEAFARKFCGLNCDCVEKHCLPVAMENRLVIVYTVDGIKHLIRGALTKDIFSYNGLDFTVPGLPGSFKIVYSDNPDSCTWGYETNMPHSTFKLYSDGEPCCNALVLSLDECRQLVEIDSNTVSDSPGTQENLETNSKGAETTPQETTDKNEDKLLVFLTKSAVVAHTLAKAYTVGKDHVIGIGYGRGERKEVPEIYHNLGYYSCVITFDRGSKEPPYQLIFA